MSNARPPTARTPKGRPRARKRRRTFTVSVLAILVLGFVAAATWWTHPEAFDSDAGGSADLEAVSVERTPFYVGFAQSVTSPVSETVTLHSVQPRLQENTARAAVSVVVCTRRSGGALGNTTAAEMTNLADYCTALRPVTPGLQMRLDDGGEYLIAIIAPTRPGRAVLESVDLTYSRGQRHFYQRGTQRFEIDTATTVRVEG